MRRCLIQKKIKKSKNQRAVQGAEVSQGCQVGLVLFYEADASTDESKHLHAADSRVSGIPPSSPLTCPTEADSTVRQVGVVA